MTISLSFHFLIAASDILERIHDCKTLHFKLHWLSTALGIKFSGFICSTISILTCCHFLFYCLLQLNRITWSALYASFSLISGSLHVLFSLSQIISLSPVPFTPHPYLFAKASGSSVVTCCCCLHSSNTNCLLIFSIGNIVSIFGLYL